MGAPRMSHLEAIAQAAYDAWRSRCGNPIDPEWADLSIAQKDAWMAVVLTALNAARFTGVL